jgi:hypothetical protein
MAPQQVSAGSLLLNSSLSGSAVQCVLQGGQLDVWALTSDLEFEPGMNFQATATRYVIQINTQCVWRARLLWVALLQWHRQTVAAFNKHRHGPSEALLGLHSHASHPTKQHLDPPHNRKHAPQQTVALNPLTQNPATRPVR